VTGAVPILISPDELARRIDDERAGRAAVRTVVLDVRWTLAEPDGRPAFRAGHIPGAVYVDLDRDLADHAATGRGRHPLPSEAAFTEAMRRWGLHDDDAVVVMDDLGNQSSARAWWLLRHAGFADVRMLDGALAAWVAAGHPLEIAGIDAALYPGSWSQWSNEPGRPVALGAEPGGPGAPGAEPA
jgi:thiosulfate/3-mercaptopyruvate sulfurtransferase